MLAHGIFRRRHFRVDQCLRLKITGWRFLVFVGNLFSVEESSRAQLSSTIMTCFFSEDLPVDRSGVVDPNLRDLARVSSLLEVFRFGGVVRSWRDF